MFGICTSKFEILIVKIIRDSSSPLFEACFKHYKDNIHMMDITNTDEKSKYHPDANYATDVIFQQSNIP